MQLNPIYEQIITLLSSQNYAVIDNFIPLEISKLLQNSSEEKFTQQLFKPAGVGNNSDFQLNQKIRRDKILWLDPDTDKLAEAEQFFCNQIADFIQYLNQFCYLGLKSYELHYARYEKGDFYQRHLDQFKQNGSRKLSIICYLNENWLPTEGGELRIDTSAEKMKILNEKTENSTDNFTDILPLAGRLVIFWADKIWHQVLPANRTRYSLTGWLKI
jgi:SM-20-related protein